MSRELMNRQSWRLSVHTYLTDTRRFQFFRTDRLRDGTYKYYISDLMNEKKGWAYWIAMHEISMSMVGYTPPVFEGLYVKGLLASSSKSTVFRAASKSASGSSVSAADRDDEEADSDTDVAVKVYLDAKKATEAEREKVMTMNVYSSVAAYRTLHPTVSIAGVIPILRGSQKSCQFRGCRSCPMIVLDRVGSRVQPGHNGEIVRGSDLAQLVRLLQLVHTEMNLVHRDLKPDNIVVRNGEIYLLDWGTATKANKITSYAGTPGFRVSRPVHTDRGMSHKPSPADDLLQLARAAYCMLFDIPPPSVDVCPTLDAEDEEWNNRFNSSIWIRIVSVCRVCEYSELADLFESIK